MKRTLTTALTATALVLSVAGCAKGPSGSSNGTTGNANEQLIVSMTVRGNLDLANDYYFVCFNYATGSGIGTPWTRSGNLPGPVPVITDFESGGNGFAGGSFTTYVEIHQNQNQGSDFGIYAVNSTLYGSLYYGLPINGSVSGNTITFRIPLTAIAACSSYTVGSTVTASQISSLNVNFITTDNISTNPQDSTQKDFDALGDPFVSTSGLNAFATIPTGQDTTYSNPDDPDDVATFIPSNSATNPSATDFDSTLTQFNPESSTAAAALDITSWTIQFTG